MKDLSYHVSVSPPDEDDRLEAAALMQRLLLRGGMSPDTAASVTEDIEKRRTQREAIAPVAERVDFLLPQGRIFLC